MVVYQLEIEHLQDAYKQLVQRLPAEDGDAELADAIDHIGSAIRALGAEPNDEPSRRNP